ncbi:MAG: T9SS type A sorting domain-containing protein, partial [Saprospiraceae bacterium]|nr:T9SS type A sorting domain-containing protein [Saprospiraceae bacterium]
AEYTSIETCQGQSVIRFEDDPQQPTGANWQALYYPNPATDRFTLELPVVVQSVALYDAEGRGVRRFDNVPQGNLNVPVNDLPAGFYTVRIQTNGKMQSGKILVTRS